MRLIDRLDEKARACVEAGYEEANGRPVTLRANTLRTSVTEVCDALEAAGISFDRVPWYDDALVLNGVREREIWDLEIYRKGDVYLQSLSSMLPPLLLEPHAGADILDMCAAPGGKTSQIAALTGNAAHLTACEMSGPRAEKLAYNLDKLGASNVNVMRTDARRLDEFFSFDQILLDAPCTGTGTYRAGDERAGKRMTEQLLAKVSKSQRALLDRALAILKPGGTLVYSTCSVLPEENDEQVRAALKRHRDCSVAPILLSGNGGADAETPCRERDRREHPNGQDEDTRPARLENALQGPLAIPVLDHDESLPGTLTVAPTRLFEGFHVAVIRKDANRRKH